MGPADEVWYGRSKPLWRCEPHDLGAAYAVVMEKRGALYTFNTHRMVTAVPGLTHEQAVRCWVVSMSNTGKRGC